MTMVSSFGRLGLSAAILLASVLVWYALGAVYWVAPLVDAIQTYLRTLATGGGTSLSSRDDISPPRAPVLMCATPGVLAISVRRDRSPSSRFALTLKVDTRWRSDLVVEGVRRLGGEPGGQGYLRRFSLRYGW